MSFDTIRVMHDGAEVDILYLPRGSCPMSGSNVYIRTIGPCRVTAHYGQGLATDLRTVDMTIDVQATSKLTPDSVASCGMRYHASDCDCAGSAGDR